MDIYQTYIGHIGHPILRGIFQIYGQATKTGTEIVVREEKCMIPGSPGERTGVLPPPSQDRPLREFLRLRRRGKISLHRPAGV